MKMTRIAALSLVALSTFGISTTALVTQPKPAAAHVGSDGNWCGHSKTGHDSPIHSKLVFISSRQLAAGHQHHYRALRSNGTTKAYYWRICRAH